MLEAMSAEQRVKWGVENLPGKVVLASSFGIQAAVCLHMVTRIQPDIPVILTDTGYLFPETYQFIDDLTARLNLNLKVYRSPMSAAWQEARYGERWNQDEAALDQYNYENKVEPMERALTEHQASAWISGIRREQSGSRSELPVIQSVRGRLKLHPIIDWSNKDVHQYLKAHDLPYHPLWDQGYVSVGDTHSTQPLTAGMTEEETRFGGVKRECGLHVDTLSGL
ncbi:MAG: phosphoadenylyl-sulfate reductase [Pseudomonadales bacterium]|nr:phosphoadenylyl-sulfate reductase [Pseudomonadales bacterium]